MTSQFQSPDNSLVRRNQHAAARTRQLHFKTPRRDIRRCRLVGRFKVLAVNCSLGPMLGGFLTRCHEARWAAKVHVRVCLWIGEKACDIERLAGISAIVMQMKVPGRNDRN